MKNRLTKIALASTALIMSNPTLATNGYKMIASGEKVGTAGAGVALGMDATDASTNPALLGRQDSNFFIALGVFHPERYIDTSQATTPPMPGAPQTGNPIGKMWSRQTNFPDGSIAISYKKGNYALGFSITGNGGMATDFQSSRLNPLFLGGNNFDSQIRYRIVNFNPAFSILLGDKVAFGISPFFSYSDFKTDTAVATPAGMVQTVGANRLDKAWGAGLRLGIDFKATDYLTLALAGQTPTYYQKFKKYPDVFLSSFDFPANVTAGLAFEIVKNSKLLLDYEYLHYTGTKALRVTPEKGGFGWKNMHVFKVGFVQEFCEKYTARVGYNYGKSPIRNNVVFANSLVPAVVEHHLAAGLTYKPSKAHGFTISAYYVPQKSQTDSGTGDMFSQRGKGSKMGMHQWGAQLAYKYSF